jgi:hypothetical protein
MLSDATLDAELAKLSPVEQDDALRLLERFYRNLARSRRHEAHLLASIANGLSDPHGLAHNNVERIREFFRAIAREEIAKCFK